MAQPSKTRRVKKATTRHLRKLDVDVDKHLNPHLPSSNDILIYLPNWISRFLGFRDTSPSFAIPEKSEKVHNHPFKLTKNKKGPRLNKPLPDVLKSFWVLVSTFAGLILVSCVMKYSHNFSVLHPSPELVPSWAATSILIYNAVESPLGQPRNTFFGTVVSAIVGIGITKLVMLDPANEKYLWATGSLNVAVASIAMGLTKTVHPPGGATALVAAIDPVCRKLGWYFLVVQIVSALLMLAVGCLFNNIQRRYPLYWWTPLVLSTKKQPTPVSNSPGVESTDPDSPKPDSAEPLRLAGTAELEPAADSPLPAAYGINIYNLPSSHFNFYRVDSHQNVIEMPAPHSHNLVRALTHTFTNRRGDEDAEKDTEKEGNELTRTLSNTLSRVMTESNTYSKVIGTRQDDMGDLVLPSYSVRDDGVESYYGPGRLSRSRTVAVGEACRDGTREERGGKHSEPGDHRDHREHREHSEHSEDAPVPAVVILANHFALPKGLELTEEEQVLLGRIQEQLKDLQRIQEEKMAQRGDEQV